MESLGISNLDSIIESIDTIVSSLSFKMLVGTCVAFGCPIATFLYLYCQEWYGRFPFGKSAEAHEKDPEILNFRLAAGPYHRPSYQTRKLVKTTFGKNEIRLGNMTVRQWSEISHDNFVTIAFESDEYARLSFNLPGDPHVPLDLLEAVNHIFEVRPSNFDIVDYKRFELTLVKNRQNVFTLEKTPKEQEDRTSVLHYRDLSLQKSQAC